MGALNFNICALMPSTPADFLTSNVDKKLVISGILNISSGGSLVLTKCVIGWKSCWAVSLLLDGGITSMY